MGSQEKWNPTSETKNVTDPSGKIHHICSHLFTVVPLRVHFKGPTANIRKSKDDSQSIYAP